jgi:hypothetical protein
VLAKVTLVNVANNGKSVCDKFGGDMAAYTDISRSLLVCVCVCCTFRK